MVAISLPNASVQGVMAQGPSARTASRASVAHAVPGSVNLRVGAMRIASLKTGRKISTSSRKAHATRCETPSSNVEDDVIPGRTEGRQLLTGYANSNIKPPTPLLDTVNYPVHMKNFNLTQLKQVAKELRADVIYNVCNTGGHLGSSLGVVELTVALHSVFDLPEDKVIWDVGHQSYPHKILTGRRENMKTLRMTNGLTPFTKRAESEYDPFGAGHSSTSISAGLGMAVGRDLKGKDNHVIAVIGDGAITGGMAYEAMNHAGFMDSNMIVILNDNQQVSLPTQYNKQQQDPVGGLSSTLARLQSSRPLRELRETAKKLTKQLPEPLQAATSKVDEYARGMISGSGSTLFEELGLYYIGTVDGHNLDDLVSILKEVRDTESVGPVLIHVVTEKGKGYLPAESAQDKYHGVNKFDVSTGKQVQKVAKVATYTQFFADALLAEARTDDRVYAVHAAMGGGTGLNHFEKFYPERVFDVGIAEQHAVTFCAGLACEGLHPFCTIYSTFLQRGYDQVVHDVALQKLPVRFMMDRAGLVGADGPTHAGAYDTTYMACLPNMIVMAPSDEADLIHMVATANSITDGPCSVRYPRGNGIGVDLAAAGIDPKTMKGTPLAIGKGRVMRTGTDVALLGFGTGTQYSSLAADILMEQGVSATVADARFCKPLDTELIDQLVRDHPALIIVEEGAIGGFGSHVLQYMAKAGHLDNGKIKVRPMCLPDRNIEHGDAMWQLQQAGISPMDIAAQATAMLGKKMAKVAA
mmetsp:Transcript_14551/g.24658  ORF Transcript_14551/g.24658 Transcript_14551/m.24658 type:complete len:753 (+) Transcript_14551:92-2350(+)|eukprot:CAMPEP_0198200912 /NCGR_PEP_ID=MMETSP1445-20131203/3798_1 /TAXON_ID=36898 /ORGANISM="Pyramimonas sp., Strain CCMP2087" /LENGTH=752 /DNA_ID=CAMNT_0043871079 /DNA_START=92 /DNA_END=2350 /DNA_ORIENTATION=+